MESREVEVGLEAFLLAKDDGLEPMGADADGNIVLPHDLERSYDIALFALMVPGVAGAAPQIGSGGAQF